MHAAIKLVSHFLIAAMATFILASLAHSQFVLYELAALGVDIDLPTRLSSTLDDLIGLMPTYGIIIAGSLLLGFVITALLKKYLKNFNYWLYPLAGFVAILCAHLAMNPILEITVIAGARSSLGLICQCLAGAFGGWAFANMRQGKF